MDDMGKNICSPAARMGADSPKAIPSRGRKPLVAGLELATAIALLGGGASHAAAQTSVVSVCSGVSLPRSVVTDIAGDVLVPVLGKVENTLNLLTLGIVDLGLSTSLANASKGAPVTLNAIGIDGKAINILANPDCQTVSDSFSLETPAGIAFGGNLISGLGAAGAGQGATAGDLTAIAIGNKAHTGAGAAGAIALGQGASVTHSGASVALGAGSTATGATLGDQAYLVGGAATAEVNIGDRRLTGVAAGSADTDAVNVAQLKAAAAGATGDALRFNAGIGAYDAQRSGLPTKIANVAAGTLDMSSTDAVNGSQLYATNSQVSTNTTTIAGNTAAIETIDIELGALSALAVRYDGAGMDVVTFQGAGGTRLTGVSPGNLDTMSTDAVNGAQLFATNAQVSTHATTINNLENVVGTLRDDALQYNSKTGAYDASRGGAPTGIANVAAGAIGATSTDAVNGAQLFATNSQVSANTADIAGNTAAIETIDIELDALSALAVRYDGAGRDIVTFQGAGGTRLTGVAAGKLDAASTDAVNGAQLHATNQQVDVNTTNIALISSKLGSVDALAVTYDDKTRTGLTLLGAGGTTIGNVAAGVDEMDAVNFAQLKAATAGMATDALQFDAGVDAYNAGRGGAPTRITNVAAGALSGTSTDAVNGAQLFATNSQVAANTTNIANVGNQVATNTTTIANHGTAITSLTVDVGALRDDALLFNTKLAAYDAARGGTATTITNVAAGALDATSTDAVNGAQLHQTNQALAALGATVGEMNALSVQYDDAGRKTLTLAGAGGTRVANVAAGSVAAGSTDAVNGSQLHATNQAVGQVDQRVDRLAGSVAAHLGGGAVANADGSVGAPSYAIAGIDAGGNRTSRTYDTVGSALSGLGDSLANVNDRVDAIAAANDRAVSYDGAAKDRVTLAGVSGTKVTNLADGELSADSSDAVTGSQLYAVGRQVATNTGDITNLQTQVSNIALGNSAYVQVNNTAGNPHAMAGGANAMAVGAGAAASGAGGAAFGANASATGINSVALGAGSIADRADSVSVGFAGGERQITNVAAGTSSTDAVNLGQLGTGLGQAVNMANAYTDARISILSFDLGRVRRDAEGGTAAAMALSAMPQAFGPGMGMFGMGVSTWQGESAVAFGVSKATPGGKVVVKAGATYNSRGQGGANAGLGVSF